MSEDRVRAMATIGEFMLVTFALIIGAELNIMMRGTYFVILAYVVWAVAVFLTGHIIYVLVHKEKE